MAKCNLIYDNNNNPIGVLDDNGERSQLFDQILANPLIKNFNQAVDVYLETKSPKIRTADQLPLTLSVFERPEFVKLQGKQVNPITVLNSLNQSGIKQIERDLIKQIIEDNYKGQNKVDYDELETTVRANIMPLERITTSSYADYGMDNLGDGRYGEAKTLIFNAPIEHGVTGHFSGDFKASGRQNIKYQAKQLNDNTWVAVEEGYESQANDNNIYQYVGTAGTKEAVDEWITNYENELEFANSNYIVYEDIFYKTKDYNNNVNPIKGFATKEEVENFIKENNNNYDGNLDYLPQSDYSSTLKGGSINKGMFGHIRVWQDGDVFYTSELQSDYFQKNNARKEILEKNRDYKNAKFEYDTELKDIQLKKDLFFADYQNLFLTELEKMDNVEIKPHKLVLYDGTISQDEYLWLFVNGEPLYKSSYTTDSSYSKEMQRTSIIRGKALTALVDILGKETLEKIDNEVRQPIKPLEKDIKTAQKKFDNAVENIIKELSPQEKQFIASQKIWEQRMVREAIKEASLSGATSLRFPTPYTLSVIEGYVEGNGTGAIQLNSEKTTEIGDSLEYLGEDYTIISEPDWEDGVKIIKSSDIKTIIIEDFIDDMVANDMSEVYVEEGDKFYSKDTLDNSDAQRILDDLLEQKAEEEGTELQNTVLDITSDIIEDIRDSIRTRIKDDVEYDPERYFQDWGYTNIVEKNGVVYYTLEGIEYEYVSLTQNSASKEDFNISNLSDTQQTVARKYEEIAEILKKEKPVEVVTDENGFDWYEAPITQEDTQSPVVAFSLNAQEPQLKYQTPDGKVFPEYGDALRNTQGEDISAGVNTVDGFKELVKISSNMNLNTTEGFINHMVKADLITHKNSEGNLVPQGKTDYKQKINADSVKELFRKQFGIKSAKVNADNTISIIEENKRENVTLTKKNGEQVTVKLSELNKPFSQLKKEYDVETTATILANRVFKENASKTKDLKEEFIPETELQEKLMSLIKKFGIKTLSFDEYLKNYSKRTNLPITAKALADLGNKLIAFKDGVIENDDLVEEVAHLVEASIPQEKKDNILRNIHKTQEWEQYSEQYKDVYATDAELRQEILGKVIANSIKEQFVLRNNNETENSILAQIKNLFLEFIGRVQAFFKESYIKELEDLNKEVFRNLMNETLDLDIKGAQVLFSNTSNASPQASRLYNTATKVLDNLREQVKTLKNSADKALLDRAQAQLEDAEDMKAVTTMVRLASSQVEIIKKALESKGKLSPNENVVFQNIKQRLTPALSEVRAIVKDEALIAEIDNIIRESSNIQGEVAKTASEDIIKMFEQVADANEFTGEDRVKYLDAMKNSLTAIQKDTDFFHAHLGSLLSARTPLLNMAGNIIERMNLQHNHYLQSTSKPFLAKVGRTALEQLYDFENGGWLMHEIDKKKEFEWEQTKKKQILGDLGIALSEGQTPDEYVDKSEDEKLERDYRKAWSKVNKSRYNKYFKEDYIKAMESHTMKIAGKKIDFNQISDEAKDIDASWRAQSTSIRIQAGNNITKPIQAQLREIAKKREADANPRNADGSLIEGLKEVYDRELGRYFIIFDKTSIGQLTEKQIETAKIIEGLNHLTYLKQDFFAKNNKNEGYPASFLQALKEADNKMEFLEMNSYISFPDSFFEELKNNVGLTARLREAGEEGLEQDIREQQSIINRVLRANKVFNRPSETDFASMNITAKTEIKFAQTRLEKLYGEARTVLSDEVVDNELAIDNVVNSSYFKHLEDAGIEEGSDAEIEFILENVTDNGLVAIKSAQRIVAGGRISKSFERYFSENMNTEERQQALVKYARTKLLPYLKRTEPIGYTNLINQVNSGQVSAEELLNRPDVIKISPNISFFEDTNENVNQDFIRNRDAKKEQWSKEYLAEVRNDKFYETFGINEKTGERTKNEELWQARQAILDFADQMIEFQDLTGKRSRYLMPQVRATEMERLIKLNPKMAGQAFKDWTTFRPEEQEKGAVTADGLYTIPTYYNTPLEDSKELTKNILYAYMMWGNQASLFKARKENINDMFIVEDAISNTRFETKKAENTQTYKMFQNFMEYNFYGVRETFSAEFEVGGRTFDAGKILMSLNRWAKKTNTTNIITPVTSLLQSSTQKFMERIIGETTNHIASNEGNKLFMKLAPGAMKEVMGFDSKSELNVIGEALGMYSAVHRFEDSQFGKPMRLALNVGGKLHELGNFPVVGRALSSIISDYRFVDGRIISYNQFKKKMNVEDFKGDIDKEWTSKEMFQPHFLRAVKNGVLDFTNEEFLKGIEGKLNVEDVNKYLEDKKLSISKRALAFVQRIDSQIPQHQKAAAQRNAITNFFLSHLSWLLTAIPNKFKQAHYNLSEEGAQQEGSWRTTAKFLNKIVFNPKKAMEVYGSLTDNEKKNLRRTLVELGFANALALTAILLARYNDDDDDPNYLLSVADMFATRLANEQISSTVGIPSGIYGVFDNPLLLKSKMEDWVKVNKLVGTPEERSSYLGKVLPFYNNIAKFSDPLDTRKKYSHFQLKDEQLFYSYAWSTRFFKKD